MSAEPDQPAEAPASGAGEGSPGDPVREIDATAARLRELAERLRDPEIGDEPVAELAREAAELVSRAGNEIDRALRGAEAEAG